eukprot:COSAG06_NODE_806_length_12168_cov_195.038615_6_plen_152_part_00
MGRFSVASICHRRARNQDEPALLGWRGRRGNADEGRTGPFEHADVADHSRAGHRAPKPRRFAQPAAPVRVSPSVCKSPTITQSIMKSFPFAKVVEKKLGSSARGLRITSTLHAVAERSARSHPLRAVAELPAARCRALSHSLADLAPLHPL